MRCHRTKCPLLRFFFFSFFLSPLVTFLPEVVILGFCNCAWGFHSKEYKIWGGEKIGGPTWGGGAIFLVFVDEKNESAKNRLKWKENVSEMGAKNFPWCLWGAEN